MKEVLKVIDVQLEDIKPYPNNPRRNDAAVDAVAESIKNFGVLVPIVLDKNNVIVAGHTRYKAFKKLGWESVPCVMADGLTDEQVRAFRLVDNKTAEMSEWEPELLAAELEALADFDLSAFKFEVPNFPLPDVEKLAETRQTLAERFLFAPFSVLDARRKEWQERKRLWYSLGLQSDLSRENMKTLGSLAGSMPRFYYYKEMQEAKLGHKITAKEFEEKYAKDYMPKNSTIKVTNTGGMLSMFDPVLCELMYYWFCTDGGKILDPFCGGSVRGIVAAATGYNYTGIDLRQEQINANYQQAADILGGADKIKWICGNSLNVKELAAGEYDFIFSCPPYFDLEIYSDNPQDLSNMEYADFLATYRKIIEGCVVMLKENRFACFVVGDVRDRKTGFYRNFVSETIAAFETAGAKLYNEIILVTPFGSLPQRAGRTFQRGRKIGKTHQNVLVFYKGDTKAIKETFKEINIADLDAEVLEE